jgi:hypothetical protein
VTSARTMAGRSAGRVRRRFCLIASLFGGVGQRLGGLVPTAAAASGSSGDEPRVEALTRRSLRWLVLASIGSRVVFTVPAALLNRGVLGGLGDRIVPLTVGVVVIDGLLAVAVWRRPQLLATRWLLAADLLLTLGVTVTATGLIAAGTFLRPGADALTGYGFGTVALWTAARGGRVGVWLTATFLALQLAMARLNGAPLDYAGVLNIIERWAFAVMALVGMVVLTALARRSARLVVAQGLRAGRLAERAQELRAMHDTALADFEAIVLVADRVTRPAADRLATIAAMTNWQRRGGNRQACGPTDGDVGLADRLDALVPEFRTCGLTVARAGVPGSGTPAADSMAVDALVGAAREALNNVVKHSGAHRAILRVTESGGMVEVEVLDSGRGFTPGRTPNGFGLTRSITERMADVGGAVEIASASGRGTRIVLRVPAASRVDPWQPAAVGIVRAVLWVPLLPLIWRILALPLIAVMVGSFAAGRGGWIGLVTGALIAGHVVLLAALVRPGGVVLLRSWVFFGLDLAVAAALFLWTATLVPAGTIITPDPDAAWTYVMATVAFWTAARGVVVAGAVLGGCVLLEGAAMMINSVVVGAGNAIFILWHLLQIVVSASGAALLVQLARHSAELTTAESQRAGRLAERVEVLARLHDRVAATWETIAVTAGGPGTVDRLDEVRGSALGMATELRAALHADGTTRHGLAAELEGVVVTARRSGMRVELVVTELTGDPPPDVLAALVSATQTAVGLSAASDSMGSVVLRVTGSPVRAEVSIRDHAAAASLPSADVEAVMASVGGSAELQQAASGGTRIRLRWVAP